jgi:hypothetical protein
MIPEVYAKINMEDMDKEIRGLATKEINDEFVYKALEDFAWRETIDFDNAKQFFSRYATIFDPSLQDFIEWKLSMDTPEEIAKTLKKSMSEDDLERLVSTLMNTSW